RTGMVFDQRTPTHAGGTMMRQPRVMGLGALLGMGQCHDRRRMVRMVGDHRGSPVADEVGLGHGQYRVRSKDIAAGAQAKTCFQGLGARAQAGARRTALVMSRLAHGVILLGSGFLSEGTRMGTAVLRKAMRCAMAQRMAVQMRTWTRRNGV